MYPFPHAVNPAIRSHLDAQAAFCNDVSQAMSRSFQQVWQLNMQLGQTLFEEATHVGQRLLTTERPTDAISAAASSAQPAADKVRAYQQQLSRLAADAQVDLTRVTEQHVKETSRTARALADDVTRVAAEETDKGMRQQEEAIRNFRDPFQQDGAPSDKRSDKTAGATFQGSMQSDGDGNGARASVSVQADGQDGKVSVKGNMQGDPSQQFFSRSPSQAR